MRLLFFISVLYNYVGMFLSKIEIHGFKSFAQKVTLVFDEHHNNHSGITAVVGPNGSGKSNIADAVRWVLGEQSVKLLRGKKSEDVIFSGSSKKARMGMAEVTLTIVNDDNAFPLEFPEIAITRRLYRDGTSEYLLQNDKIRLIDLQLLLARAGIGGRSYAVIGQGMIDNVLTSTPVERKDFFDEAAGVKEFEIKKRQTENKLAATKENITNAKTVIAELEPRVRTLSRSVKKLEERESIESELKNLQFKYYGSLWYELSGQLEGVSAKEKTLLKDLVANKSQRDGLLSELSKLETKATTSEELLALQREYERIRKLRDSVRDEMHKIRTELEIEKARATVIVGTRHIPQGEISAVFEELKGHYDTLLAKLRDATTLDTIRELHNEFLAFQEKVNVWHGRYKIDSTPKVSTRTKELEKKWEVLQKDSAKEDAALTEVQKQMQSVSAGEQQKKSVFFDLQRKLQDATGVVYRIEQHKSTLDVERARIETRRDGLKDEMMREVSAEFERITAARSEDIAGVRASEIQSRVYSFKHQLEMIGGIDPETVKEYEEVKTRYDYLVGQVDDLSATILSLENGLHELNEEMRKRRTDVLQKINKEFDRYFKILFLGGNAEIIPLYATEDDEEREEGDEEENVEPKKSGELGLVGIDMHAQPPGKRIKDINILSGGERAMTSVALICAILSVNPAPFVILDEVDAALDEANSIRFAEILETLSKKTQFIVVSHNRASMQKSKVLYGVTMGDDGVSQLLSVELDRATQWAR